MAAETAHIESGDLVYLRSLSSQRSGLALVEWVAGRWARIVLVTDTYPWDGDGDAKPSPAGITWTLPAWRP